MTGHFRKETTHRNIVSDLFNSLVADRRSAAITEGLRVEGEVRSKAVEDLQPVAKKVLNLHEYDEKYFCRLK